ncbi:hypothetical protein [Lysinibacillus pakistanensis]|uniref:Uncharacterized protein n=1 Tax=Lysinibacillus pakistanensis TaxID=759811 RepID=A0ABX6DHT7_9BACI|nr:hypothetical protein GDS87_24345 [Lysinibacillus pakistanensis]QGG54109.1 hypothetical protein GDS87_24630 [Lysinibacillus pakistanensis]
MIELIFEMLYLSEHYGQSELIEIAKGKNELPEDWKDVMAQIKRKKAWQKKG